MYRNHRKHIIIFTLLLLLFTLSIVTAEDSTKTTNITTEDVNSKLTDTNVSNIPKNYEETVKSQTSNKTIYVDANGDSTSDGTDSSSPTTLSTALNKITENATIYLMADEEDTYYNINSVISTSNVQDGVKSFSICGSEENRVILNFSSSSKSIFYLTGDYNITISNIDFSTSMIVSTVYFLRNNANLTLQNCNIYNFSYYDDDYEYGTIYNQKNLILDNCTFHDIANYGKYGIIYNRGKLLINNSLFYYNWAYRQGVCVYTENANVIINNSKFDENIDDYGCAVSARNSTVYSYNSTFNSNIATYGGVFFTRDNSRLYIYNSTFYNNSALQNGGVINTWYSSVDVNSSIFTDNNARYGGIIYSANNNLIKINNSLLSNNTAIKYGSLVYSVTDNLVVTNNVILDYSNKSAIYQYDSTINLDENWWGKNNPDFYRLTLNNMPNNWRLLKAQYTTLSNKNVLTLSLNQLSDSTTTKNDLYIRNATFTITNGQFNYDTLSIKNLVNNTYTGSIDNVHIYVDDEVICPTDKTTAYLYTNNNSAKINDNVTLKIYTNPDNDGRLSIKINDTLLANINLSDNESSYVYRFNSTWKTGNYTIYLSLTNSTKYNDTTQTSMLTLYKNYNSTVSYISPITNTTLIDEKIIIPPTYNSVEMGYVTSIKDQQSSGSCWAFSSIAALESALLKNYNITANLSEDHMKNTLKMYSIIGDNNSEPSDGGNDLITIMYMAGWFGPVSENVSIYDEYSLISPTKESEYHIQDVYFIPDRNSTTDNNLIKQAIIKYGSVATDMYSDSNPSLNIFTNQDFSANHAINIVGWDDNYAKENFRFSSYNGKIPEADGAWIIKNSWGENIGQDGYQYVSYYDKVIGGLHHTYLQSLGSYSLYTLYNYVYPLNESESYDKIYQHDTISTVLFTVESPARIRNIYTVDEDETLAAIGTLIYENCDYETCIYVNGKLAYTQNGNITQPGFRTIKLDKYVQLRKGDVFTIELAITAHVGNYSVLAVQNTYFFKPFSDVNQSFISYDGENWNDLYTDGLWGMNYTVACLKAYTKQTTTISSDIKKDRVYNIRTQVNDLTSPGVIYYKINGEYFKDESGNIISIEINENGTYTIELPLTLIEDYEYDIIVELVTDDYDIEEVTKFYNHQTLVIISENMTYYADEEKRINFTVSQEDENINIPLNYSEVLLIDNTGKIINKTIINSTNLYFTLDLDEAGDYTYTLRFRNESNAFSCEDITVNITVIKRPVTIEVTNLQNTTATRRVNITGNISIYEKGALKNQTLTVNIDGINYNIQTDIYGNYSFTHYLNRTGNYNYTIIYEGNNTLHQTIYEGNFTSEKESTILLLTQISICYYLDNITITGTLYDINENKLAKQNITVYINTNKYTTIQTDNNGNYNLSYQITSMDINNITVKFNQTSIYNPSQNSSTIQVLEIIKHNITLEINNLPEQTTIQDIINFTITLKDKNSTLLANQEVTININNNTTTKTTNATGEILYSYLVENNQTLTISASYDGNIYYNQATTKNNTVLINKINTTTNIQIINSTIKNVKVYINVTNSESKLKEAIVSLIVGETVYDILTLNDGEAWITLDTLNTTNDYTLTVIYAGNDKYSASNVTTVITRIPIETKITASQVGNVINNTNLTLTLSELDSGNPISANVTITLANSTIITGKTSSTGQLTIALDVPVGNNTITIYYAGNNTYLPVTQNITINVSKIATNTTVKVINRTAGNVTFKVIITDDTNTVDEGNLTVKLNGNIIYENKLTNENLITNITSSGTYSIIASYEGSDKYQTSYTSTTITVITRPTQITATIQANKVTSTQLIVNLTDTITHDPIANAQTKITLTNGTILSKTTTSNGIINTTLYLNEGTHNITITYNGNNIYTKTNTTITTTVSKITTCTNITILNRTAGNVTLNVTVKDENYNIINDGTLTVTANGTKLYEDTVSSSNILTNISLSGIYHIDAMYTGSDVYGDSRASSSISVSARSTTLTAQLYGNKVSNTTLVVNLADASTHGAIGYAPVSIILSNGTTVYRTTSSTGIINTTMDLNAGTYNITVSYAGNGTYAKSSKTLTASVSKIKTTTTLSVVNRTAGNVTLNVTVKDENYNIINDGTLTVTANGTKLYEDTVSNHNILINMNSQGSYLLTTIYNETNIYQSSKVLTNITVKSRTSALSLYMIGNNVTNNTLVVNLSDASTHGIVTYAPVSIILSNGTVYTMTTSSDGIINTSLNLRAGTYNITVYYAGNGTYASTSKTITTTIIKNNIEITLNPITGIIGEDIQFTATLRDENNNLINGGNLVFKLNGKTLREDGRFDSNASALKFTVTDGVVNTTIKADLYLRNAKNLTASYSGNYKYNESKSDVQTAQIQKRYANITVTVTPSMQKHYETITFKAKLTDITKNYKNNTLIYDNTKVAFKINNVTLKDADGNIIYVNVGKDGVAQYNYSVPSGMGGLNSLLQVRNYTLSAIFIGENYYPDVRAMTIFNIERSNTTISICNITLNSNNYLSVKANITDYKSKLLAGENKILLKINGKSYVNPATGKIQYYTINNGIIDLSNVQINKSITVKRIMIVNEQRQAYLDSRIETSEIIRV